MQNLILQVEGCSVKRQKMVNRETKELLRTDYIIRPEQDIRHLQAGTMLKLKCSFKMDQDHRGMQRSINAKFTTETDREHKNQKPAAPICGGYILI